MVSFETALNVTGCDHRKKKVAQSLISHGIAQMVARNDATAERTEKAFRLCFIQLFD